MTFDAERLQYEREDQANDAARDFAVERDEATAIRHQTSAEAFLEALALHPDWRLRDGRVHRGLPGYPPMTVNAAADRFAELGWIRCHGDGQGGHYWTAHEEALA